MQSERPKLLDFSSEHQDICLVYTAILVPSHDASRTKTLEGSD